MWTSPCASGCCAIAFLITGTEGIAIVIDYPGTPSAHSRVTGVDGRGTGEALGT
jgi:hypothetical protein